MYMKLVLGRMYSVIKNKKQMHSVGEVLHSMVFSKLCIRKSETHDLISVISNNSTASILLTCAKFKVWMTIVESGWNVWVWLVGVVSRKWVWLVGVGGIYGCDYWVWL